ncbi:MAG: cytochrome c [Pseudomonadota bacterium]
MNKILLLALTMIFLLPGAVATAAVDADKLHTERCTSCHGNSVYTRPDRRIQSMDELSAQVNACGHGSGKPLVAEERNSLIRYLNERYYKFK